MHCGRRLGRRRQLLGAGLRTVARADTLIVIERSRWLCLWRIAWRSAFDRDGTRPDLPEGCPEQFDGNLMREAWRYNADRWPRIEAERLKYGAEVRVVRLNSDREIEDFLDAILALQRLDRDVHPRPAH